MSAPAAEERRRRRAAALAAGTKAVGPGSTEQHARQALELPAEPARDAARAAILATLVNYLSALSKRSHEWLSTELSLQARAGKVNAQDIAKLIADEDALGQVFAERAVKRTGTDLTKALAIPDPDKRSQAVQAILARERTYASMRSEAMAARAIAALDRVALRVESPQGAFWKLSAHVQEHTAGCLIMGGKFWPWAVLDRVHPPRHPGCPCKLKSYSSAVTDGDMQPGQVVNVADAVRRAAGVVMEAEQAQALLDELELREQLVSSGVSAQRLAQIPLGGGAHGTATDV